MDDTISRRAALNTVEKMYKICEGNLSDYHDLLVACFTDLTPAQRWIPCSERLPKEDGNYLVTFEEGYAEDYGFDSIGTAPFEVECEGFGIWQEEFDRYTLGSLGSDWVEIKVIAWMPLPEPWKGEEK